MNGTNCQMIVLMIEVKMFKNKIDRYMIRLDEKNCWTLNKPMASLSTCHLELVVLYGNLVKQPCLRKQNNYRQWTKQHFFRAIYGPELGP